MQGGGTVNSNNQIEGTFGVFYEGFMHMGKWKGRKSPIDKVAMICAAALATNRFMAGSVPTLARELEYDGTTQMATTDYTLDVDAFAVDLVVEEVYAEAGTRIEEGGEILKLTQESYQEALDYYEAAILRAENELTDTQREYDQGVMEAKYDYEKVQMEADQAEFVREYQQEELTQTIADYEEIQTEITDRIAELEAGSYGSSSSGGSSGGSSASSKSEEKESESEAESERMSGTETESETGETAPGMESETGETAPGMESESGAGETMPETESESGTGEMTPGTEAESASGETSPDTGTDSEAGETAADTQQQITDLKEQLEAANESCNTILEELMDLLQSGLQASIDGDRRIYGEMQEIQEKTEKLTESLIAVAAMAGIDCDDYLELLDGCATQIEADIAVQETVQSALAGIDSSEDTESAAGNAEITEAQVKDLLSRLDEASRERSSLYGQLMALVEERLEEYQAQSESSSAQIEEQRQQIASLASELEELKKQSGDSAFASSDTTSGDGTQATENGSGDVTQSSETMPGDGTQSANSARSGSSSMPSGSGSGSGSFASSGSGGSSMVSGSASGGSTGTSGSATGTADTGTTGGSMSMADLNLTEEDISLFGDTYDLTQIENMLEREPGDSDGAQELIGQLEDSLYTVTAQYEELIRNQKSTQLTIQYTYDSSVLAGKLAEITYEQELQEWEDTLAEARDKKTELEEQKETLESMADGIVTAAQGGTVAAVNYEAEDVLSSMVPLLSYYNTDVVTVTISVPQEEIAMLAVGDTADVVLSGMRSQTGTITEKSLEAQEGTSRTVVNYEVTVSMDNTNGRLTAGTAAAVSIRIDDEGQEDQDE